MVLDIVWCWIWYGVGYGMVLGMGMVKLLRDALRTTLVAKAQMTKPTTHWLINNFWVFGGSLREVFGIF